MQCLVYYTEHSVYVSHWLQSIFVYHFRSIPRACWSYGCKLLETFVFFLFRFSSWPSRDAPGFDNQMLQDPVGKGYLDLHYLELHNNRLVCIHSVTVAFKCHVNCCNAMQSKDMSHRSLGKLQHTGFFRSVLNEGVSYIHDALENIACLNDMPSIVLRRNSRPGMRKSMNSFHQHSAHSWQLKQGKQSKSSP